MKDKILPENFQLLQRKEIPHFDYVDALRGFAIILVLIVHAMVATHGPKYFRIGQRGVQLFYVVSAYTLMLSLQARSLEKREIFNYFIRRFFRVAPMFYVALLVNLMWRPFGAEPDFSYGEIFVGFLMLHGFSPKLINTIVIGGWSVGVEFTFYLVLPFLFNKIKTFKSSLILMICSGVVFRLVCFKLRDAMPEYGEYFTFLWFPVEFPVFCMGVFSVFLKDKLQTSYSAEKLKTISKNLVAAGTFLFLIISVKNQTLYFTSLCFIPILVGLSIHSWRFFVNRFMVFVGKVSYSMYLLHFFIIILLEKLLHNHQAIVDLHVPSSFAQFLLFFLVTFALSLPLSFLSWRFIETPFIRLGRFVILKLSN